MSVAVSQQLKKSLAIDGKELVEFLLEKTQLQIYLLTSKTIMYKRMLQEG